MSMDLADSAVALVNDLETLEDELEESLDFLDSVEVQSQRSMAELNDSAVEFTDACQELLGAINRGEESLNSLIESIQASRNLLAENLATLGATIGSKLPEICAAERELSDQWSNQALALATQGEAQTETFTHLATDVKVGQDTANVVFSDLVSRCKDSTQTSDSRAQALHEDAVNLADDLKTNTLPIFLQLIDGSNQSLARLLESHVGEIANCLGQLGERVDGVCGNVERNHADVIERIMHTLEDLQRIGEMSQDALKTGNATMTTAAKGMQSAMNASALGLRSAIGILHELRELFEKVV